MRQRQVRLGHADRQCPHAALREPIDPLLTFRQELHIRRAVEATGERLDLFPDRRRRRIDGGEVAAVSSCAEHGPAQLDATLAAPGEAVVDDRVIRAELHRQLLDQRELAVGIARKPVDGDDAAHAERTDDVDVGGEVFRAAPQCIQVLLGEPGRWQPAVGLERAHRSDQQRS